MAVVWRKSAETIAKNKFTYNIANIGILYISVPQPKQRLLSKR